MKCYEHAITAINGPINWPETPAESILPPEYKQGVGRPKKLRRREPDEEPSATKYRRTCTKKKCGRCREVGHNVGKCPVPPPEPETVDEFVEVNEAVIDSVTPNENPVGATANVDATNPQFDNEVDGDGTTVNLTGSGINEVYLLVNNSSIIICMYILTYLFMSMQSNRMNQVRQTAQLKQEQHVESAKVCKFY